MENKKQSLEIASVFSKYGPAFLENHPLCTQQLKAFDAISTCRTSLLGGHAERCDHCGHTRYSFNSCRNRHCPKCQMTKQLQWVDKLKANLLPTRYFHVVFTIPDCLNKTFYINQKVAYGLMFRAAGQALLKCALNPGFLGAQTGAVAVLHTWGQTLAYHPHIHMIVPAGGLSEDDMEWIPSGKKFFVPVKAVAGLFRGILCRGLKAALTNKQISLPEDVADFDELKRMMYGKKWHVYCKKPLASADRVIAYLGQYTHRVAISNHRLVDGSDGQVTFRYKDYKTGAFNRHMTLDAREFINRFMMHILPCGFYKIRYFGILAQCNAKTKTAQCFEALGKESFLPLLEGLPAVDLWRTVTGSDPLRCPVCGKGNMLSVPFDGKGKIRDG